MNARPDATTGRQIRKPPTRCSWCHGARVTAIKDRRLGAFGVRSACADCYQREEGRPWTGAQAVAEVQPAAPVADAEPVVLGRLIKPARFAVLERAAMGRAAATDHLPTGRALATQLGCMRAIGWLDDADRITGEGRAVYLAELDLRAAWVQRRGPAVLLPRPERSKPAAEKPRTGRGRRLQAPRIGDVRWALLTAAASGRWAEWLTVWKSGGRPAATQAARMVAAGWLDSQHRITAEGRRVLDEEAERRARWSAWQDAAAGGGR